MKNKFLLELKTRGYLHQCTNIVKLSEECTRNSITGRWSLFAALVKAVQPWLSEAVRSTLGCFASHSTTDR